MLEMMRFLSGGEHSDSSYKLTGFSTERSVAIAMSSSHCSFRMSLLLAVVF